MADENDIPITKYPSELHPLVWGDLDEDEAADPRVRGLHDALNVGLGAWRATVVGHQKVMADPLSTPDQNMHRSHKAAERRWNEFEGRMMKELIGAKEEITALDAAMNRAPKMPSEGVALHIAGMLRGLSDEARINLIATAMKNKAMDTVGAALFFSDPDLFGISPQRREVFKAQYRLAEYPDLLARKARLEKWAEHATRGLNGYRRDFAKMYDTKRIDAAQKKAQAAAMALE